MPMTSLVLAFAVWGAQTPKPSLDDLAWMAGCWELTRDGRHVIEQWMPAEGGTMLGMSRAVANGKTVEYEFLLIRPGPNGLDYVAKPSGQAEGTFTAGRVSATAVVFENPAHDFPTTISVQARWRRVDRRCGGTDERPDAPPRVSVHEGGLRREPLTSRIASTAARNARRSGVPNSQLP